MLVGRERELESIDALISDRNGAAALLLEGAAGIGKTAVWLEGISRARTAGLPTLVARPAEGERSLPYAALGDLIESLVDSRLHSLPEQQQNALEAALQRSSADEPAEQLAVSRGTLSLLRTAAGNGPVLLAVDDVQWLDPPTASVLTFILRRVGDLPVRALVARRSNGDASTPLDLDRAFLDRHVHLRLQPLSLSELDLVLRERLGIHLPRPRLAKIHRACVGNPFYALEIARALEDRGDEDVPLPEQLSAVLAGRLAQLPADARHAVLLASACLQPNVRLVERAAGDSAGLAGATAAEVVEVERDRLRFTHPLLGSAAYAEATPWERREAHARLAAVADNLQERAHHLARATEEPDEIIALELARAASEAAAQGVPETASDLGAHAVRLTPADSESRLDRELSAVRYRLGAGDPVGAIAMLESLASSLPPGPGRAKVLISLADVSGADTPERAFALCAQALAEAGDDPALGVEIQIMLCAFTWNQGQIRNAWEHSREAVRLAREANDRTLLAMSFGELFECEMMLGLPVSQEAADEALALEHSLEKLPLASYSLPSFRLAGVYLATDRLDEARPLIDVTLRRIDAAGDEAIRWGALTRLSALELRAGELGEALRHVRDAMELVRLLDSPMLEQWVLTPYAQVLVVVGDLDGARDAAARALELAERSGNRQVQIRDRGVLGHVALCEGDPAGIWEILEPAVRALREMEVGELSSFGVAQNAIEALVALGRLEEAEELIAWVEEKGRPTQRAWHAAVAARGRALVAAERGDIVAARGHIVAALDAHERLADPVERGRTLVVQGRVERRLGSRGTARNALTAALMLFDTIGAARWSEISAAELARVPGRRRSDGTELTETERRVAELAADGLANKEIAARMFVSLRTVEANLTRAYRKLGVRSRMELGRALERS